MDWSDAAAISGGLIAVGYAAIFASIVRGLSRTGQLRTNRLGQATATIFLTCSLRNAYGVVDLEGAIGWDLVAFNVLTAGAALYYWSLRHLFHGADAAGPLMYDDLLRRERERRQTLESAALRRSNEELERFAHVAAHDLGEPVRIVDASLELLRRRYGAGALGPDADELIDIALTGSGRMRELIDALLRYARVDAAPLEGERVALRAVVQDTLRLLGPRLAETRARVRITGPLPIVTGEASRLGQLFQNLLGNALKFAGDRPPRIEISAERLAGCWRIDVRDHGIGIDPAHADLVFEPFRRLHSRDRYEGSGLGLAICQKVVLSHGGVIGVAPAAGGGTLFWFTLPDEPPIAVAAAPPQRNVFADQSNRALRSPMATA